VAAAFPEHPPYDGLHEVVVPHLTLALGSEAELDQLQAAADATGLAARRAIPVRQVVVIAEGAGRRWDARWRIRLRP
jgi:hypothetical protein